MSKRLATRVHDLELVTSHLVPIIVFGHNLADAARQVAELGDVDRPVDSVCWLDAVSPEEERGQKAPAVLGSA